MFFLESDVFNAMQTCHHDLHHQNGMFSPCKENISAECVRSCRTDSPTFESCHFLDLKMFET